MPNVVALSLIVSDKKIFKDFEKKLSAMETRVFEGIKFFQEIQKRTVAEHFIKIG